MVLGLSRLAVPDPQLTCPRCAEAQLALRVTCLSTRLSCPHCRTSFTVAALARDLDDEAFSRLAQALGDRLSDRV